MKYVFYKCININLNKTIMAVEQIRLMVRYIFNKICQSKNVIDKVLNGKCTQNLK